MTAEHEFDHSTTDIRPEPGSAECAAARLALIRIRETRRARFAVLTGRDELFSADRSPRFYAPWSDDPTSIADLTGGIYVHAGITAFWRAHRHSTCHGSLRAHADFARGRVQVTEAMVTAANSGLLTEAGQRLLAGLAKSVRAWGEQDLPGAARRAAAEALLAHRIHWRVRNLVVEPRAIDALMSDFDAGRMPRDPGHAVTFAAQPGIPARYRSLSLVARLLTLDPVGAGGPVQLAGDRAYLAGYLTESMALYQRELRADPLRPQAWAGYALAASKMFGRNHFDVLTERPEILAALYSVAGPDIEILELVRWLSRTPG
ncbi:aKG-HExxH-type peptide beta-hydroxylase [Nocardia sp. NPDC003693]